MNPDEQRQQFQEGWDAADDSAHEYLDKLGVPREGKGLYLRLDLLAASSPAGQVRSEKILAAMKDGKVRTGYEWTLIGYEAGRSSLVELIQCIIDWEADYRRLNGLFGSPEWVGRARAALSKEGEGQNG